MLLGAALEKTAEKFPEKTALVFKEKEISFKKLNTSVSRFAAGLKKLNAGPGERAAVLMPNCTEFIVSFYGIVRTGATALPVNPSLKMQELQFILENSRARFIVTSPDHVSMIKAIKPSLPLLKNIIVTGNKPFSGTISYEKILKTPSSNFQQIKVKESNTAVIIYTSGTTGKPKGAMLSHKNLISNVTSVAQISSIGSTDTVLSVLPLFHAFGMTACMNLPLYLGSTMVLLEKFVPDQVVRSVKKYKVTVFAGVPTMFAYLLNQPAIKPKDFSSLRFVFSGGAPLAVEMIKSWEERFGIPLVEGYGPTEASPVVTLNTLEGQRKPGSVGVPVPDVCVKIVNENGEEVPTGETGELLVSGPNVMKGYFENPEATHQAIREGWLHTGDLAKKDEEGFIYIVDRKHDMVIVGGFNVYPREVEEVLYAHPKVLEAGVVGVRDQFKGEAVKAYVAPKPGSGLSFDEIMEHCKENLAPYKVPRFIEFRESLPKSDTGKILKKDLT